MHWFFCLWNSPQYEQSCAIQLGQPTSVCSASNKSVLIGTSHSCDLQIQAVSDTDIVCEDLMVSSLIFSTDRVK